MSRVRYTQSPGGIRRGGIWQSSNINITPPDPRFHLFTPFRRASYTPGLYSYIYLPDQTIQLPTGGISILDGTEQGLNGFKLPITTRTGIQVPLYPYTTTIQKDADGNNFLASFADEMSYYADMDFYISPNMCIVGDPDEDASLEINSSGAFVIGGRGNHYQVTNGPYAYSKGYYLKHPGECRDSYTDNMHEFLDAMRISYPSCPMRIQMRCVYSDYPFSLSAAFTGGQSAALAIEFPNSLTTDYLTGILDAYDISSITGWRGAAMNSKNHGHYYTDFAMPAFQKVTGTRTEKNSSASAAHKWYRYTDGAVYDGLLKEFQMYLTPLLYPATSRITTANRYADYELYLPSVASDVSTQLMQQHADPYMIPPEIITPDLNYVTYAEDGTPTPTWYNRHYLYSPGEYTGSSYYNNTPLYVRNSGLANDNYIRRSMMGAHGVTVSSATSAGPLPTSIHFNNLNGQKSLVETIGAAVQPHIVKGQQYLQEFMVVVAKCDTDVSGGALTGRYKYLGFKGVISFFESL